ncbi:MAG: endo-1,4-beta-glucanase [Polyangiales bacterium]
MSGSAGVVGSAGSAGRAGGGGVAGMSVGVTPGTSGGSPPSRPGSNSPSGGAAAASGAAAGSGTAGALANAGSGDSSSAGAAAAAGSGDSAGSGGPAAGSGEPSSAGAMAAAGSGAPSDAGSCQPDASCAAPANGVTINCQKRFMFGVNYAWINFGEDFGGGARGVAATQAAVLTQLQEMKASGVNVIRWWMHPSFYVEGVSWDAAGNPTGIAGSEAADIEAALALAEQAGVYLKLTLFSFDNFRGDDRAGHGLTRIITGDDTRAALIENVVKPIARSVAASPHAARMISWDVINEPEWAISGEDGLGDEPFDANPELMAVPFPVMERFVGDVVTALHAESKAPVTVGQAAIKWSHAFTQVNLDYYDVHFYGWVDQYFPIGAKSLADYGLGDKPVVVGEFPLDGWTNPNGTLDAEQIANKLFDAGYAGAKGWAFTKDGNWAANKGKLQTFAAAKGCGVNF